MTLIYNHTTSAITMAARNKHELLPEFDRIVQKHGTCQQHRKYQLGRTIGEGTFAKVKLALDSTNGKYVAIKVLDKHMVQREIRTMKLLNHSNIVRIHEVIGTKTKIYIVMEYVSGGQLSDKMSYAKRFSEGEARKLFQQLIDAVDYCHNKGVYHRDLKPENLLLCGKGSLKISDFGLSALRKPGDLLSTKCGSPSYVAPELLVNKVYDGAAADVWSCGVILFELLAGNLPFDDSSLMSLYRKICRADYTFPKWFTESQKKLISRILDPNPETRITIPKIMEIEWFQKDYMPSCGNNSDDKIHLDDVNAAFDSTEDENKQKTRIGSKLTINETIKKIEAAAMDVSLSVERTKNLRMKMHAKQIMNRCSRSYVDISAESLSSQLREEPAVSTQMQEADVVSIQSQSIPKKERPSY
ncbi:CBL-interacting protein kinase 21 [Prunus dulcis]|uniref:CBL-interacting protein kinase 21 n=1 Tax=Prunus dulcis TaxID=3755 RepID=A0A4Y1QM73_PRUDU|nr:CBL-interacting protein kinase 21 [Prunus dulcis]